MKFINLTPHTIVLFTPDGVTKVTEFPSEGMARVNTEDVLAGTLMVGSFPVAVNTSIYGATEGLPDPEPNHRFIVSMIVAQANSERIDLICPDTFKGAVRDSEGKIIGTKNFVSYAK